MTTSALVLPVSGEQDLASWAAIAFVASYSSPGTRQAYTTQRTRHHRSSSRQAVIESTRRDPRR
jgi:hypothetical protein